jgi:multiple sugar transport system substrate-binding protein
MFNQLTYKPAQVVNLTPWLNKPNPYAPANPKYKTWHDWFPDHSLGTAYEDVNGNYDWVPFNLFDSGIYVNADAFAKAGVPLPIKTWQDLVNAVPKLKKAGYIPMAMDGSQLYSWIPDIIINMMMNKYFNAWNYYLPNGKHGKATYIGQALNGPEDWARVIKSGTNIAALPEFAEALQLTKWFFDNAVSPNWSGIKGLSGIGLDIPDFVAGKTAMAFGADFAYPSMSAAKFKFASMPFPTITTATTPLSENLPAEFGASPGGTSYLIPASTKGNNLTYAVKFLQFMTSPTTAEQWIKDSAGAPAVYGEVGVPGISAFNVGAWANPMRNGYGIWTGFGQQESNTALQIMTGYLLGSTSLKDTQSALESAFEQGITYEIGQNPNTWGKESWAK